MVRVLYVGDVVGKPGRKLVETLVPKLKQELSLDFVIINAENSAGGFGITPAISEDFLARYADALTSGNHIWQKKDVMNYIDDQPRLIRPANYPPPCPGRGHCVVSSSAGTLAIIQVEGRVFMKNLECPFRAVERELDAIGKVDGVLVDIHAEATSEKQALGWYLDGKVSAVLGTHTHVQTADDRILPKGTAYLTDVGMTGSIDSVIGMRVEDSLIRVMYQRPTMHSVATENPVLHGVVIEINNYKATAIERIQRPLQALQ